MTQDKQAAIDLPQLPEPDHSLDAAAPAWLTDAARDVLAERRRQVEQEGWTPELDDDYADGQLSMAAACYAQQGDSPNFGAPEDWPWNPNWWKPTDDRRNLVKAGALILADIERLDRADGDKQGAQEGALLGHASATTPEAEGEDTKPIDCSSDPSNCPDNEGYGCHCSASAPDEAKGVNK